MKRTFVLGASIVAATGLAIAAIGHIADALGDADPPNRATYQANAVTYADELRLLDRLDQVLEEIVRVREDFGYPIMVTPFAQFVGSQAAINVITGERYKEITDQVIQYALGMWGKEGADYTAPEVKAKILDRPRAAEIAARIGEAFPCVGAMRQIALIRNSHRVKLVFFCA